MTTISTGGFANYDASFGVFQGPLEYVAAVFMLLAALMVADELHEKDQRVTALEEEVAALKAGGAGGAPDERIAEMETAVAQMLDRAAAQIEVVTGEIEAVKILSAGSPCRILLSGLPSPELPSPLNGI